MEPAGLREDLKQEMFKVLCEMEEERLVGMHTRNELRYFLAGIMWRMATSTRSEFYVTHRHYSGQLVNTCLEILPNGHITGGGSEYGERHYLKAEQYDTIELDCLAPAPMMDRLETALANLDPYEEGLFKLYAEMGQNCAQVSRETQIPVRSVGVAIAQAKTKLKTDLRKNAY
jgi:hypothetical protein